MHDERSTQGSYHTMYPLPPAHTRHQDDSGRVVLTTTPPSSSVDKEDGEDKKEAAAAASSSVLQVGEYVTGLVVAVSKRNAPLFPTSFFVLHPRQTDGCMNGPSHFFLFCLIPHTTIHKYTHTRQTGAGPPHDRGRLPSAGRLPPRVTPPSTSNH